ncbi:MAG: OmpA family protein [Hyphomicrobium sp.]
MRMLAAVLSAATLGASYSPTAAAAPLASRQAPAQQSAEEILDDGLDALKDNETALARKLFDHLIASYPGTAEAGRAALELEVMGGEGAGPAVTADEEIGSEFSPVGIAGDRGRIAELRREFLLNVGDRVFFSESSAEIGGRARAVIDHQARWLGKHLDLIVTIIGRADDGGSTLESAGLSMQRAQAVQARLISGGVEPNRILLESRGDRDPLALCRTALCQSQNRNVETMIGDAKQAGGPGRMAP